VGSVDTTTYGYNVRGWVSAITGSRFTENLYYNQNTVSVSNFTPTYNGNIAAINWNIPSDGNGNSRVYTFGYDGLNRLTDGAYSELSGGSAVNGGRYNEIFGYDKMGNITNFARGGLQSTTGGMSYGTIDNLTLTHNGNQLVKVSDSGNDGLYYGDEEYVVNKTNSGNCRAYDANGNSLYDSNSNVWGIKYNILNLPDAMQFYQGHQTLYTYSATGTKLEVVDKTAPDGVCLPVSSLNTILSNPSVASITTTDYVGNMIYQNGSLLRILLPEGYYQNGAYYYYLKDHLGSNRVVMKSDGSVVESSSFYPSGMRFGESVALGGNVQPYRHTGHEMQSMHGLNWIDNLARFRTVSDGGSLPTVDPLCEKYYNMSPYAYCMDNPINAIDFLGMDTCKVNKDGTVSPLSQMNEVTCTAPATYKSSWTYSFFGELAFGNRGYLSERKNSFIWTNKEINEGVKAELQAGLMLAGGVGTSVRIGMLAYRGIKGLDIAVMAGKALGDAIGQFGGNMLKGQAATQALANINLVSVGLSGLGVDPISSSALSNGITININQVNFGTNSDNYLTNTAIGSLFGSFGNSVNNLSQYKGLTIGVQMRISSTVTTIGVNSIPTMVSNGISNSLTSDNP
jgi:hypothetical protein